MYWLDTEWKTGKSEFNYRQRRLLSHHSIQTISVVQSAFYPVGIGRKNLYDLTCWRPRTRWAKTPFSPTFSRGGAQGQLNETVVQKWVNERELREFVELIEAEKRAASHATYDVTGLMYMQQDPAQPNEEHSTHIKTWTTANRGPHEADKYIKSNCSSTLRM